MENKKIVIPTIFALILITLLLVFGPTAKNSYLYQARQQSGPTQ
jgi:hypothetical protein